MSDLRRLDVTRQYSRRGLTEGLVVEKILKADARELVIEFADGTRLLVRGDERLDISVT